MLNQIFFKLETDYKKIQNDFKSNSDNLFDWCDDTEFQTRIYWRSMQIKSKQQQR
jgi:hypothetical protein